VCGNNLCEGKKFSGEFSLEGAVDFVSRLAQNSSFRLRYSFFGFLFSLKNVSFKGGENVAHLSFKFSAILFSVSSKYRMSREG